jgi:outer membrane protein OmpA-like peptidoglycan-associated protein
MIGRLVRAGARRNTTHNRSDRTMTGRLKTVLVAICLAAFTLAGCESVDSFAHDPEKAKTRRGAGYGAAAGAVVGLLTAGSNPFKSAMIGAAAGALVGGSVGYYMDKQEAKLRQQMAGTGVEVVRTGDNITLDMPGNVTFAFDSSDLNAQFYPVLDKVAATLKEYDKTVVEVAGHTDSVGSDAYNQTLSEKRANSVAAYLSNQGMQRTRMVTIGAGEGHPVATNDTEDGRAQNRRVEITIVPVSEENVQKAKTG